ncbi:MAG: ABC transporter ATP-binding protein [Lentisphaeria bacterium]|nr:ABC transporter ATP-binding protein [Lentisphaeria bacterium]
MSKPLLEAENISVAFNGAEVVSQVSFSINPGEVLALVGESGCGKSSVSLALTRLLPPQAQISADHIRFHSRSGSVDLAAVSNRQLRKYRGGGIAYIFQEPSVSLNPVMTVRSQIAEVLELHGNGQGDLDKTIIELLSQVGIPDAKNRLKAYPHELSGGMQQRVMIAMALAGDPELLIADEPTTALDVTVQAQILELLDSLRKERGMAILLISHNLGVVSALADRIAVMYAGRIVEHACTRAVIDSPFHPYTRALLAAVPQLGRACGRLQTIPGMVPLPSEYGKGCRFAGRCQECQKKCLESSPVSIEIRPEHFCSCFQVEPKL